MYDTQTNRFTLKQFFCTRYQVYYSQSQADGRSRFQRVNWWSSASGGLYRHPLLPRAADVYQDFNGRTFFIPVLHVRLPWFSRNWLPNTWLFLRIDSLYIDLFINNSACVNRKYIYGGLWCPIIFHNNDLCWFIIMKIKKMELVERPYGTGTTKTIWWKIFRPHIFFEGHLFMAG